MDFNGNGDNHSGPLTFGLEGVDDYRLCLYATHFIPEGRTAYVPPIEAPNLLAERLLHVDLPVVEPPTTTPAPERLHCKRHHRRVTVQGKELCRRIHRKRHRHPRHRPELPS
jgi:hypothetical protein